MGFITRLFKSVTLYIYTEYKSFYFLKYWLFSYSDKDGSQKSGGDRAGAALAVPRLSVCADAQKVDRAKLAQTEVRIYIYFLNFQCNTF